MNNLLKKILIIGSISVCFIGIIMFNFIQDEKENKQKEQIEEYVNNIVEDEENIKNKINEIKNSSFFSENDSQYILKQINNIWGSTNCLYSFKYNKIKYLDTYVKSITKFDNYKSYEKYLRKKYYFYEKDKEKNIVENLIQDL